MRAAAAAGRSMLTEPEAKAVLSAYGIPTVADARGGFTRKRCRSHRRRPVAAGAGVWRSRSCPEDISHKSDVGGVRLGLRSAQEARPRRRADAEARAHELQPEARIEGFTVQPMVARPNAHELLMGVYEDRLFGPDDLVRRRRHGNRDHPRHGRGAAAARCRAGARSHGARRASSSCSKAIATGRRPTSRRSPRRCGGCRSSWSIARRSRSSTSTRLLADETGMIALDARIRIEPSQVELAGPNPQSRHQALSQPVGALDRHRQRLSRLRSPDHAGRRASLRRLRREAIAGRHPLSLPRPAQGILAQIHRPLHADRLCAGHGFRRARTRSRTKLLGVARLAADPDYVKGEYAIIVRSDLKGTGIGWALMRHLIHYAEKEGLRELVGDVLASNERMLGDVPRAWLRDRGRPRGYARSARCGSSFPRAQRHGAPRRGTRAVGRSSPQSNELVVPGLGPGLHDRIPSAWRPGQARP